MLELDELDELLELDELDELELSLDSPQDVKAKISARLSKCVRYIGTPKFAMHHAIIAAIETWRREVGSSYGPAHVTRNPLTQNR